ncbi:hypothetical protein VNO77_38884 [Canavalia gladiata]|uniref:F-box domain-containing protein n=1 Tax=Canavalia gladiata TaxID=3824 RepID=A0AAN9KC33_CANGL
MSDYLPEALVLEILYRLPPKTLLICMSVCKAWKSTIKSHTFISSHLQKNLSNPTLSFLLISHLPRSGDEEQYLCNGLHTIAKLRYSFPTPNGWGFRIRSVATVNGVICLSDNLLSYTDFIVLWNPFIHKHIQLPIPIFTVQTLRSSCLFFLGLGFDSKKKDFKMVRVCYRRGQDARGVVPPLVELYSLNEGAWRIIDASSVDVRIVEHVRKQCFLHGNVHWLAYEGTQAPFQNCVLMFNVEEENFKKLKLPPELSSLYSFELTISLINGCLSLVDYVHEVTTGVCNIWMQRESESWNKMYSINLQSRIQKVFVSRTSDEIFAVPYGQSLHVFDSKTQKMTNLGIQGIARSFSISEYTQSLVLLDRENDAICPINKR